MLFVFEGVMLSKSYLDKSDHSRSTPRDRVLYDLFKRVHQQGRITEFVNLQTGERADNGYILQQVGSLSLHIVVTFVNLVQILNC